MYANATLLVKMKKILFINHEITPYTAETHLLWDEKHHKTHKTTDAK